MAIIKSRKDYVCDFCERPILKGQDYILLKGKSPKFDGNDKQIGIEFWRSKLHSYNCCIPETCRNGLHSFKYVPYNPNRHDDDSGYHCQFCGASVHTNKIILNKNFTIS